MDIKQLRASGLLELYVIGQCSDEEKSVVEQGLIDFPELKNDLYQIGGALEVFAKTRRITPSDGLKESILKEARKSGRSKSSQKDGDGSGGSNGLSWIAGLLGLATLALGYLYYSAIQDRAGIQQDYDKSVAVCDSIQRAADLQYALVNQLQDADNQMLVMTATEKYADTDLFILYNSENGQNFLQINNLPPITDQQSYQLWSLKPDQAPIPLTVFQGDEGGLIPIAYEDGTATYAITIEARGGVESPTLEDLIGTVNVPI